MLLHFLSGLTGTSWSCVSHLIKHITWPHTNSQQPWGHAKTVLRVPGSTQSPHLSTMSSWSWDAMSVWRKSKITGKELWIITGLEKQMIDYISVRQMDVQGVQISCAMRGTERRADYRLNQSNSLFANFSNAVTRDPNANRASFNMANHSNIACYNQMIQNTLDQS